MQALMRDIKAKIKDMLPTIAGLATGFAGLRLAGLLDDLDLSDTKFSKFEGKIKGLSKGLAVASIAIAVEYRNESTQMILRSGYFSRSWPAAISHV